MKTIEEFIKEFEASKELKEELKAAYKEAIEAFLKKHGCEATAEAFSDYVRSQKEGEISDDAAMKAAGGAYNNYLMDPESYFMPI